MMILDRHKGYDDIVSSLALWPGHVGLPTWQGLWQNEIVMVRIKPDLLRSFPWAEPINLLFVVYLFLALAF
jgi:hypothetical protein